MAKRKAEQMELTRLAEVVRQTELLVQRFESRFEEAKQLSQRLKRSKQDLLRVALQSWWYNNFSDDSTSNEKAVFREMSRGELRKIANTYLEQIGMPALNKNDDTWMQLFLRDCVGITDERELRSGKNIPLYDSRDPERFEKTLEELLAAVRQDRASRFR